MEWTTLPENAVLLTADQEMSQDVIDAKGRELKTLLSNDVFEIASFVNQNIVSSHWIITEKYKDAEKKLKGRLVTFKKDINNLTKDSPTFNR